MYFTPKHIENLKAYKAGKSLETLQKKLHIKTFAKLSSNENPLGPSPKAMQAVQEKLHLESLYPDPKAYALKQTLSKMLNLSSKKMVFGSGIDSLLAYIYMSFSQQGDKILTSEGSFIGAYVNANKLGRTLTKVPLMNWGYDLDRISASVTDKTKIIYIANPNNPTGKMISKHEIVRFLDSIPKHALVILDQAYYEYAIHHPGYESCLDLIDMYPLIITRTMSKAYGLAGIRAGYAMAEESVIETLHKVKLPFEPGRMAQLMAQAAFEDQNFLKQVQELNKESMNYFKKAFDEMGLNFVRETGCNSLMMLFDEEQKCIDFFDACFEQGLIMRPLKSFGIPNGIRINTGTMEQNEFAVAVMKKVLKK